MSLTEEQMDFKAAFWGRFLLVMVFISVMLTGIHSMAQRQRAPMYFSAYAYLYTINDNQPTTLPMDESRWQHNIDYVSEHLAPLGFDMIVTDGWGEDIRNAQGFRIKHHSSWNNQFSYWANYAQTKGLKLGLYENPLWINATVPSTQNLYDQNENATWFNWLQVGYPGAENYIHNYIDYYASFGVDYLRVDFLSWYEDGKDKLPELTNEHGRPVEDYQTALSWLNQYCDANDIQLSLVMPHLYNHGANERQFAPGSMIRVNEDVCEGGWYRLSEMEKGVHHDIWSQYHNTFDGMIYWSDISGFDDSQDEMIMDGDFIWLSSFANDDEKKTALTINLIAGGAIALTEYDIEDIQQSIHLLQNNEVFALNEDGFVGKPLSHDVLDDNSLIWKGQMSNGDWVVAMFNRDDYARNRSIDFSVLGFNETADVRDLWAQQDLGAMGSYSANIPAHGCVLLKVVPTGHQREMNIAGSFNSWTPNINMAFANEEWVASDVYLPAGNHELKFVNTSDWSDEDWGGASGLSGTAISTTGGGGNISFTTSVNDTYMVTFDDISLDYSIVSENTIYSGGTYSIRSVHSGKVLDVELNSMADGGNIHQWENFGASNQKWVLTDVGVGQYSIVAESSGRALDVEGSSTSNGANIHQWQYFGNDNQKWYVNHLGDGMFSLISVSSGKSIDIANSSMQDGANIHQWSYFGGDSQKWYLDLIETGARQSSALESGNVEVDLSVYPNPVENGHLVIELPETTGRNFSLNIYDLSGTMVYHINGQHSGRVALDDLPLNSGLYLMRIESGSFLKESKIVVK
ncbi:RICIN domain-containing protein [Marinoscillum sp. MHG1-6]|uniref:RICIN domain-containing protein n=1 Tax=Marinoscillum sp. MHG1-6 TaxID=2959627 RepID=UPI002157406C|nr:RICIN domain-containing protein [Marinoscillum sp. MHG1-6]